MTIEEGIEALSKTKINAKWLYDICVTTVANLQVEYQFGSYGENNIVPVEPHPPHPPTPTTASKKRKRACNNSGGGGGGGDEGDSSEEGDEEGEDEEAAERNKQDAAIISELATRKWERLVMSCNKNGDNTLYGTTTKAPHPAQRTKAGRYFRRHFKALVRCFKDVSATPTSCSRERAANNKLLLLFEMRRWRILVDPLVRVHVQPPQLNWTLLGWGAKEYAFVEFMRKTDFSRTAINSLRDSLLAAGVTTSNTTVIMSLVEEEAKFFK